MKSDTWLLVIPSVKMSWAKQAIRTLKGDGKIPVKCLIVDNTKFNYGVSGAWNLGIDQVIKENIDWLVICSESMRFGPNGAEDIQRQLTGASKNTMIVEADNDIGWHLIAFRRQLLETLGYFEELFFPAYFEDNDYIYRYKLAHKEHTHWKWQKVPIDANLLGIAQGILHLTENIQFVDLKELYTLKWGGSPNEVYLHPYNDKNLNYRYAQRIRRQQCD